MKVRRPNENTMRILKMFALGALIVGIGAVPSPKAVMRIFRVLNKKDSLQNRKWIRRRLYALHEQQYVAVHNGMYSLSELGQRVLVENRLWSLSIPKPKVWDRTWHIVVFDIPKEKTSVRMTFVRLLQNLGFVYYQRSVWIHPYECADQVREIAVFYEILPFVAFIKATHANGSHVLRQHFKL